MPAKLRSRFDESDFLQLNGRWHVRQAMKFRQWLNLHLHLDGAPSIARREKNENKFEPSNARRSKRCRHRQFDLVKKHVNLVSIVGRTSGTPLADKFPEANFFSLCL
jgi:hypothetical protein